MESFVGFWVTFMDHQGEKPMFSTDSERLHMTMYDSVPEGSSQCP